MTKKSPGIKDVKILGSSVLVEMLTAKEALGTEFEVPDGSAAGAPQGYVLKVGPKLDADAGIKVGDRVLLQGTFVPLAEVAGLGASHRQKGIVEPHNIKAILVEG